MIMEIIKNKAFKKLGPLLFFFVLSVCIIFSWFKEGLPYGGGDVGLQTFNSSWYAQNAQYIWWEATAPGFPVPQGLTSVSLHFFFSILEKIGFLPWMLQASLFFIFLFLMGYGMYLFVRSILKEEKRIYAVLAGLFYMLNPYMMIQVWHRFIHNTMFLAAVLPFLTYFWLRWIQKGELKNLLIFLLINLLSVYLYGSLAFIVTVWLWFFLITLGRGCLPWLGFKNLARLGWHFALGLILWILINSWWLIPMFIVGPGLFSEQHSIEESIATLINLGLQTSMPFMLQVVNPYYLFQQLDLGKIYLTTPYMIMPWLLSFTVFIGLIKGFYSKNVAFWSVIFVIIVFLSKGAAEPFSKLYILGFTNFYPLGIIRNPFEKIGILMPFLSSILFAFGILWLFNFFKNRIGSNGSFFLITILVFALAVFSFPMFTGGVLGNPTNPGYVKVPDDIGKADKWIKSQKTEGKILHLPLSWNEDVKYRWEHGYSGLDPNALLFTSLPSISHGFSLKALDNELALLSLIFSKQYSGYKVQTLKLLQDFDVRFVVLHKDTDWLGDGLYDPLEAEQSLNGLDFVEKKVQFGNLIIYEIKNEFYQPKIILSDASVFIYPTAGEFSIWPRLLTSTAQFVGPVNNEAINLSEDTKSRNFVFPKSSFVYGQVQENIQLMTDLTFINSRLEQLKSFFNQNGLILSRDLTEQLIMSSQVLTEITKESNALFKSKLDDYRISIAKTFRKQVDYAVFSSPGSESIISSYFRTHLTILKVLENKAEGEERKYIAEIESLIKQNLLDEGILPETTEENAEERQILQYEIPVMGGYDILKAGSFTGTQITVNGTSKLLAGRIQGDFMSFGKMDLNPGTLEISYPLMFSENLAPPREASEVVSVSQSQAYIEVPVRSVKGGDLLRLSVDAKMTQGNGFYVSLYENNEAYSKQGIEPPSSSKEPVTLNSGDDWRKITLNIRLKPTTETATFVIFLPASNNVFSAPLLSIKDIKIQKILTEPIILTDASTAETRSSMATIEKIERKSPVEYIGKINIDKPTFLFFKESYHSGWELSLLKDDQVYVQDKHLVGNFYGNVWYVNKLGEYNFKIQFKPNGFVIKGIMISSSVLLLLCIVLLTKRFIVKTKGKI